MKVNKVKLVLVVAAFVIPTAAYAATKWVAVCADGHNFSYGWQSSAYSSYSKARKAGELHEKEYGHSFGVMSCEDAPRNC